MAGKRDDDTEQSFPTTAKFLLAGVSGMTAALLVHPLDFMKVRMQMSGIDSKTKLYSSTIDGMIKIYKKDGFYCFYSGGSACLLRQAVYTTARLGVYTTLFDFFTIDDLRPSFFVKAMAGMTGGLFGGFIATPVDLCLVRMISDKTKSSEKQFNYRNVFYCMYKIFSDGGLRALYRGGTLTTMRAIVVNGIGLAFYSQIKEGLKGYFKWEEGVLLHFNTAMLSGFIAAVTTLPLDNMKTRRQTSDGTQKLWTLCGRILRNEGITAFWKGFTPYYIRIGPITVLTFVLLEQLTYLYGFYVLGNKNPKSNL